MGNVATLVIRVFRFAFDKCGAYCAVFQKCDVVFEWELAVIFCSVHITKAVLVGVGRTTDFV